MMISSETALTVIYLRSGELYLSNQPAVVVTVLGSCVSITMFYRRLGLSAISHGQYPHCRNRRSCGHNCNDSAKYVECSFPIMLSWFKQRGVPLAELEVSVIGGADMIASGYTGRFTFSVGKQNIETAMRLLGREGLRVRSTDVEGNIGRKIHFNTQNGHIQLQYLQPTVVLARDVVSGKTR